MVGEWRKKFVFVSVVAVALSSGVAAETSLSSDLFHGLEARAIGPATTGGRISAIDVVESDPDTIVIGAAAGGVWISDDGGLTWRSVFDDQPVSSIGAIAINQSNPDIIWVGTGEGNVRNSVSVGAGMFKSLDGGKSWDFIGLAESERIDGIALHPTDPDTAYVAALGSLWKSNEVRGIYKTTNGGKEWSRVLYGDEDTGAADVQLDPSDPNKVFAAMWQFRRAPNKFTSGGPGSGLFVSNDGGDTWERRTSEDGLPDGELGKISIGVAPSSPSRVYALVEAAKSALIMSEDGGARWRTVNDSSNIAARPFYFSEIVVDPTDANRIYNLGVRVGASDDGGKSFEYLDSITCCRAANVIHVDHHALWVNPQNPNHLIAGNDGGLAISRNRGETWRFIRNLPLLQFYKIAVDDAKPYNIYGGTQDNGAWRGPSEVLAEGGIRNFHWQELFFGDAFATFPDPLSEQTGYVAGSDGFLYRWNLNTGEKKLIKPLRQDVELRFNWNPGFAIDPFDGNILYFGSQFVHKSSDKGMSWQTISDDLTTNNPDLQVYKKSGGLTPEVSGAENYTTITTIAPSALRKGVIWVGTDDGRVHVTKSGGRKWTEINGNVAGLPPGSWTAMIYPSPHDAGSAFVVFDDHRRGDMKPYVYRIDKYGQNWTSLATNQINGNALSILQDPVDEDVLFLGTEFGLFISINGGADWFKFQAGIPSVPVTDLKFQEREADLVIATHGRSLYVIDDVTALRRLDADVLERRLTILSTVDGQQFRPVQAPSSRFPGNGEYRGANEPYGVMLTFFMSEQNAPLSGRSSSIGRTKSSKSTKKAQETSAILVEIADGDGQMIRRFPYAAKYGVNRLVWDMKRDRVRPTGGDTAQFLPGGTEVPPGRYRLRISFEETVANNEATAQTDVLVLSDPRAQISRRSYAKRYQALLDLDEMQDVISRIIGQVTEERTLLKKIEEKIAQLQQGSAQDQSDSLGALLAEVELGLDEFDNTLRVRPGVSDGPYHYDTLILQLFVARRFVESEMGAPRKEVVKRVDQLKTRVDAAVTQWRRFLETEIKSLRERFKAIEDQ